MPDSHAFKWKGFEFKPEGCLLEQVIEMDGSMGIAYERGSNFYKDYHVHDRLMLVIPRGSSLVEVRTATPRDRFLISSDFMLLVPAGLEHDDQSLNSIYDTFALYPDQNLLTEVIKDLGLLRSDLEMLTSKCHKLPKSVQVDKLIQDYFFERIVAKNGRKSETYDLEKNLLLEIVRLRFNLNVQPDGPFSDDKDSITIQALKIIEANLFEKFDLNSIAKRSGASVSTLIRKFKLDTGQTPYSYAKHRRLDEAMRLLKTTHKPVGDVAILVGYENFGAFSDAFKARFGLSPSNISARGAGDAETLLARHLLPSG